MRKLYKVRTIANGFKFTALEPDIISFRFYLEDKTNKVYKIYDSGHVIPFNSDQGFEEFSKYLAIIEIESDMKFPNTL